MQEIFWTFLMVFFLLLYTPHKYVFRKFHIHVLAEPTTPHQKHHNKNIHSKYSIWQASERAAGAHQSWQQPWAGQCILLLRQPGRSAAAATTRSDPAGGSASRSEPRTDGSRRVSICLRPLRCFSPAGRRRRTRRRGSVPATRSGGTGGCKHC